MTHLEVKKAMGNKYTFILTSVLITALISRAINNIILTLSPVIAKFEYHIPLEDLGLTESLVLVSIIISMFSVNLIYSKKILILSFLFLSISLILLNINNLNIFFISLILAGLSFGVIIPSMTTIASSIANEQNVNTKLLKIYNIGLSLGAVVSTILEAISTRLGVISLLLIILSMINIYNIYFYYYKFYSSSNNLILSLKVLFNRKLWIANLISLPYDIPIAFINVYLALLAKYYYHLNVSLGFLYFFTYLIVSFLSRYFIYKYNTNEENMKLYSMVLTIGGSMLLMIGNPIYLLIGIILLGIPHGLLLPLSNLVIAREFKDVKEKNLVNSVNLFFHYIIFIIVPLIIGLFINISIFYGILTFIILSVSSSLLLLFIKLN
ncbi:MFS transporter [Acidianus brierleyi]|uniref:MFS transporter n=1 Tax=Acidianus brierleyi TaxID=41673 RepID=A0A2U9IH78_9CREN|nr:MFS transporter [Acidianus brierleyi]AWR95408.1 hypothetical protein DFR85_13190 [Acidianus brierleyi]